jgi:tetratricopeptide (TPR) repeat protein
MSQAGEPAMLRALGRVIDDTTLLVSYNGRAFDVPLMDMRWAFHRQSNPFDDVPHFDMLPTARRLWSRRESAFDGAASGEASSCSLSTLERDVLGFHRVGDVPGFEIPARYFQFLRTGDGALLGGVLDHHRHDIVSLAVLMSHALRLAQHGPDLCRDDHEVVALGRLYERIGQPDRAREALERASQSADRYVRAHACSRLGLMHRRAGRHDEAAAAWRGVLDAAGGRRSLFPLERAATEALAIHLEHRAQDLDEARRFAESMRRQATGRAAGEAAHRLARLDRKLGGKKEGGPKAAPLLDKS